MDGIAGSGFDSYAAVILGEDADRRRAGLWLQRHTLPKPDTRKGLRHCIRTAAYLWDNDQRPRAVAVLEVAFQAGVARYGSTDNDVLAVTRWLVAYLCDMADDCEAQGDLQKARELAERAQLVETDETATRADFSLAQVLKDLGEFDESARLQRKVLAHLTERAGPSDLTTIHSMIQLSNVLQLRGNPGDKAEARLLVERARSSAISSYGEDSPVAVGATELLSAIKQDAEE